MYQFNDLTLELSHSVQSFLPDVEARFFDRSEPAGNAQVVNARADLVLSYEADKGLVLTWFKPDTKKPLLFNLSFVQALAKLKSFPAAKQGAFNQALGKKTQTVLDVTGGWGGDAMLMATQGYAVHVMERNPLMALLLSDAFNRLAAVAGEFNDVFITPTVHFANSIEAVQAVFNDLEAAHCCAYLDPMFPPKRKKSAAVNKHMQLLQALVGQDVDAPQLLQSVLACGVKRAAVKRPDYAQPLLDQPSQQFSSKLVHYDVYC